MSSAADLFAGLVFASVLLLCAGLWRGHLQRRGQRRQRRLRALLASNPAAAARQDADILRRQRYPGQDWPLVGPALRRLGSRLDFLGWSGRLRGALPLLALACVLGAAAVARQTPHPLAVTLLLAPWLLALCAWGLYRSALARHVEQLREQLPGALESIVRTTRAGIPVSRAFGIAAEHLDGALGDEFRTIDHWLHLGVPLRQAIQTSAQRVPLPEYRFFAVVLIINQEIGGRLGDTLERLAATLRARQELALQVLAKTSEVRASSKIVAALAPACLAYLYVQRPDDFRFLLNDTSGQWVLGYAMASLALGLAIVQLMTRRVL